MKFKINDDQNLEWFPVEIEEGTHYNQTEKHWGLLDEKSRQWGMIKVFSKYEMIGDKFTTYPQTVWGNRKVQNDPNPHSSQDVTILTMVDGENGHILTSEVILACDQTAQNMARRIVDRHIFKLRSDRYEERKPQAQKVKEELERTAEVMAIINRS